MVFISTDNLLTQMPHDLGLKNHQSQFVLFIFRHSQGGNSGINLMLKSAFFNYLTLAYLYEKQGSRVIYLTSLQWKEIAYVDKCLCESTDSRNDIKSVNLSAN